MQNLWNSAGRIVIGCVLLTAACDTEDSSPYDQPLGSWVDDSGRMSFRGVTDNATAVNGFQMNQLDKSFRGGSFKLNSPIFNSVNFKLNGFAMGLANAVLNNAKMVGNRLALEDEEGDPLEGVDLEDVRAFVQHKDPQDNAITDYEIAQTEIESLGDELFLQSVKQRVLPGGQWINACENNAKAVLLKGEWNQTTGELISTEADRMTWACAGAALGDCAIWGYIPGKIHSGISLNNHHKACTRLKRADYCGDGEHHTENGHSIDVYDSLGILTPETVGMWDVEALWGPSGAICLNFTRKLDYSKDSSHPKYIGCEIPACVDHNSDGVIDFADYPEALLATRTVPTWKTGT